MDDRYRGGMARFGLPGVVLGIALAWIGAVVWTAGDGPDPSRWRLKHAGWSGIAGCRRQGSGSRAAAGKRRLEWNVGPGHLAFGLGPVAVSHRHQEPGVRDLSGRPDQSQGIVKLEASRQYQWDLKLEHYNNQPPEPAAIEATVKPLRSRRDKPETARRDGVAVSFPDSTNRPDTAAIGRSRPRGARPWLSFIRWKKPPAFWG